MPSCQASSKIYSSYEFTHLHDQSIIVRDILQAYNYYSSTLILYMCWYCYRKVYSLQGKFKMPEDLKIFQYALMQILFPQQHPSLVFHRI